MLKIIAIVIVVAIIGVVGYASTKPDVARYERRITINAPAEKIFPYINDFEQWRAWSPYEKKDPDMKRVYGVKKAGKDAAYEWDGDDNIGAGRMDITEVTEPSRILIRLEFFRPFAAVNTAEFTLQPVAGGTEVRWIMTGPANLMSKLMGLFIDLDGMIGKDFDDGLATLKTLSESGS